MVDARIVPSYLGTNDCLAPLAAGRPPPPGSACRKYQCHPRSTQVREEDGGDFVLLTSANFTNTPSAVLPLLAGSRKPYGDKGFVVFRKGGDGAHPLLKNKWSAYSPHRAFLRHLCK